MEAATIHHTTTASIQRHSKAPAGAVAVDPTTVIDIHEASPASSSDPALSEHQHSHSHSQSSSSDQSDSAESSGRRSRSKHKLKRPPLGSRKSSGTIIISREAPVVAKDEEYDENDARAMSPKRSDDEIEKMGEDARQALEEQAQSLQSNLLEIIERVDSVKSEHEKLEGGNKFLQSYIGELMQTSKIVTAGAPKNKKRSNK